MELVDFGSNVADQRCIFHKLLNMRRERRQAVPHDAHEVYQGKDAAEMRRRLAAFRATKAEREAQDVAALGRDFAQTVAYLAVQEQARHGGQEWRTECLRTTSPLERAQQHFRQKARQVEVAHSEKRAEATVEFVSYHHDLASGTKNVQPWVQRLEVALLAVWPHDFSAIRRTLPVALAPCVGDQHRLICEAVVARLQTTLRSSNIVGWLPAANPQRLAGTYQLVYPARS